TLEAGLLSRLPRSGTLPTRGCLSEPAGWISAPLVQRALTAQSLALSTQRQPDQSSPPGGQSMGASSECLRLRGRRSPVSRPTLVISYRGYIIILSYSWSDLGTYPVTLDCE